MLSHLDNLSASSNVCNPPISDITARRPPPPRPKETLGNQQISVSDFAEIPRRYPLLLMPIAILDVSQGHDTAKVRIPGKELLGLTYLCDILYGLLLRFVGCNLVTNMQAPT